MSEGTAIEESNGGGGTGLKGLTRRKSVMPQEAPPPPDKCVPLGTRERLAIELTGLGAVVMLLATLVPAFPWARGAGLYTSYSSFDQQELTVGGAADTFGGVEASGGSWMGILAALAAVGVLFAVINTLVRPGEGLRWLGPDGAVLFSIASAGVLLAFVFASPAAGAADNFSRGWGVWLALLGGLLAAGGALWWMWLAPMTARVPLSPKVSASRILAGVTAVLLLTAGGYAGWTYDTRTGTVITPELQAELDQIEAEGKAAEERAKIAEAAGDEELASDEASIAAARSADIIAKRSEAQRTGDVVINGFSSDGARLGTLTLLMGVAALLLTLPAGAVFGPGEILLYRWAAPLGGLGLAISLISAGWIGSLTRLTDENFVSGMGIVLVLGAGVTLFSSVKGLLSVFDRRKSYADIAGAGEAGATAADATVGAAGA